MTIKDLMVHVDDSAAAQIRLELGYGLAAQFGARVTALYLIAEPFLRGGTAHAPSNVIHEHLAHADAEAESVLAGMAEEAERRGVQFVARKQTGSLDRLPSLLARDARNTDLVIVGQPNPETGSSDEALLVEAAFMETGRPALMVPHAGVPAAAFKRVVVAWNASRESSRAVHDALPLLAAAEDVVILVVDPESIGPAVSREPGSGVVAHLVHHGIPARVKAVESDRRNIGDFILAQAGEEAADLLVIGGYGHSRLREALLGGATRALLERATLPVLLSH